MARMEGEVKESVKITISKIMKGKREWECMQRKHWRKIIQSYSDVHMWHEAKAEVKTWGDQEGCFRSGISY